MYNNPASRKVSLGNMREGLYISLILIALLLPGLANASVNAQLDRDTVNEGDTFTLTLNVAGGNHAQPDLSPLQHDFDVLGTGQKNMIQIVNGNLSSNRSWTITLSPKHTGKLRIPAITVGKDHSQALTVTVIPAGSASSGTNHQANVFLDVSVKPEHSAYVQSQLIYTVRLYYAEGLQQGSLSDPSVNNAIVQKLGKDSHFATQRGGRQYQVIERRYAIFPQSSGELKIPGVVFDGQVNDPSAQSGDPFFDTFNPPTRHVRLHARALELQINPPPAAYSGNNWLPAQSVKLCDTWSPVNPSFHVGEPVTRDIMIQARGLSSSQLPDMTMAQQAGLKLYPDQPQTHDKADGDTLVATREQKIAMIPTHAGELTLPAMHLSWWDTQTQTLRTTSLPAQTIHVLPALSSDSNTPVVTGQATGSSRQNQTLPASTNDKKTSQLPVPSRGIDKWFILACLFAGIWLLTLLLWWRYAATRSIKPLRVQQDNKPVQTNLLKDVRQACREHNPKRVKTALLAWAKMNWPDNPPLSLGELATRVGDQSFSNQINALDKVLYTQGNQAWQSQSLLDGFNAEIKRGNDADDATQQHRLAPLYLHKTGTG